MLQPVKDTPLKAAHLKAQAPPPFAAFLVAEKPAGQVIVAATAIIVGRSATLISMTAVVRTPLSSSLSSICTFIARVMLPFVFASAGWEAVAVGT